MHKHQRDLSFVLIDLKLVSCVRGACLAIPSSLTFDLNLSRRKHLAYFILNTTFELSFGSFHKV
jgi:hypothetical protein